MAKNERAWGRHKQVGPFTTGKLAGDLIIDHSYPGVVLKTIIGTTEPNKTVEGREISGEFGDGLGDIAIEGVHKFVDETFPAGSGMVEGTLVFIASASGVDAAGSAGERVGHVFEPGVIEDGIRFVQVKLNGRPFV